MPPLTLPPGSPSSANLIGSERRGAERRSYRREVLCNLLPNHVPFRARALDISLTGIGLLTGRELRPDWELIIELQNAQGATVLIRPARVAHCTLMSGRTCIVGCRFEPELGEEELRRLLDEKKPGEAKAEG
jgi:PilZ domain